MLLPHGYNLHAYDTLDSTNAQARRIVADGTGNVVVWAKQQSAGRGRYDRSWISDEGNLFVSFLLPTEAKQESLPELSFVAALAAADAIGDGAQLKWPNDILLSGKKAGGILLESGKHQGRTYVIVGIGINVATYPDGVLYPATSLAEQGVTRSVEQLLEKLVQRFDSWYECWQKQGFAPIHTAWLKSAYGVGESIEVKLSDGSVKGLFSGIAPSGTLQLHTPEGLQEIAVGDVFFKE